MKLFNKSEKFVVMFDGKEYTVPNGEFDVASDVLGNHIKYVAKKWDKGVDEMPSKPAEPIKKAPIEKVVKEEKPVFSGATTETLPKKFGKKNA